MTERLCIRCGFVDVGSRRRVCDECRAQRRRTSVREGARRRRGSSMTKPRGLLISTSELIPGLTFAAKMAGGKKPLARLFAMRWHVSVETAHRGLCRILAQGDGFVREETFDRWAFFTEGIV